MKSFRFTFNIDELCESTSDSLDQHLFLAVAFRKSIL